MSSNILFITEGIIDEPKFLEEMFKTFFPNKQYNIYSYKTSIHTLIDKLFTNGKLDEGLDIRLTLRETETDEEKRKVLSEKYKDIFLIFDMDPHNSKTRFKEIREMSRFFSDSSNKGKLYINYPMMQSYKHLKKMPDNDFKNRRVEVTSLSKYKEIVGKESEYTDLSKYKYPIFMSIIGHHIKKANYIINRKYEIPTVEEFLNWDYMQIYDKQIKLLEKEKQIYILNTFICNIIEYKPKKFLNQFTNKKETFLL